MQPHPMSLRVVASLVDTFAIAVIGGLLWFLPTLWFGLTLPVLAMVAGVMIVSVLPVSAFGASPGKAIVGLEVVTLDGGRPDGIALAFRELVGRGQLGFAYLSTLLAGLAGYATGSMSLTMPWGLAAFGVPLSLLLALLGLCSTLVALTSKDQRGLHDRLGNTVVRLRSEALTAVEPDEDLEAFRRRAVAARRRRFVIGELILLTLALGTPYLLTRKSAPSLSLRDEVRIMEAKKQFDRAPTDPAAFDAYAELLRRHAQLDELEAATTARAAALEERRRDPAGHDYLSRSYTLQLEEAPCDRTIAVKLAERLNEIGAHAEALTRIDAVFARCPPFPRLRWPAVVAHRALGQLDGAIAQDTLLIEASPLDADYWSWRAQDRAASGDVERAHADFWMSVGRATYRGTAQRLADLWRERSPCDALRALRFHATRLDDEGLMEDDLGDLDACLGTGRARIPFKDRQTDAVVSGQRVRLSLHPEGLTVVSSTVAARARLELGPAITVLVDDAVVPARLARASVRLRGVEAADVRVAVVDALPAGLDGMIGLDFISHFVTSEEQEALVLVGRAGK